MFLARVGGGGAWALVEHGGVKSEERWVGASSDEATAESQGMSPFGVD